MQNLALLCDLIAPTLSSNCVKRLKVTKVVKEIKFQGVWGVLAATIFPGVNHLQKI